MAAVRNTSMTRPLRPSIRQRRVAMAVGLAALSLGLGGCFVAYPYQPYPSGYVATVVPEPQYVTVYQKPPMPRVEVIGVAPAGGMVWIPGNWVWRDRWVWRDGYWARPPHPHAHWYRGRWEKHDDRDRDEWYWARGRWR